MGCNPDILENICPSGLRPSGLYFSIYPDYNPCIISITLYTPWHQKISWDVFAKKSADIMIFRNSFITISKIRVLSIPHFTLWPMKTMIPMSWYLWKPKSKNPPKRRNLQRKFVKEMKTKKEVVRRAKILAGKIVWKKSENPKTRSITESVQVASKLDNIMPQISQDGTFTGENWSQPLLCPELKTKGLVIKRQLCKFVEILNLCQKLS